MRHLNINKQFTNRENKFLDKYLTEISKFEMITSPEETYLANRVKKGNELALEKLVCANLRFVVSVAKQYQNQGLALGDLINEGNIGLIKAANLFDPTHGYKFITYAIWWIRQAILQALVEVSRLVRLPSNRIGLISKIGEAAEKLEQRFEREATAKEIAELLNLPIEEVKTSQATFSKHLSLFELIRCENDNWETLIEIIEINQLSNSPIDGLIYSSLKNDISRIISILNDKEREVITLFFGLEGNTPHSYEDLSEKLKLTGERVRQIKVMAIKKLLNSSKIELLKVYLENIF